MVGSLSYQLQKNKLVSGFGLVHRPRRNYGSGVVRKTIGAISRPALTYVANKIADMISGEGIHKRRPAIHRRKTVRTAGSFRPTGFGMARRAPRKRLTRVRHVTSACGYRRKPRSTLHRRSRTVRTVRRVLF